MNLKAKNFSWPLNQGPVRPEWSDGTHRHAMPKAFTDSLCLTPPETKAPHRHDTPQSLYLQIQGDPSAVDPPALPLPCPCMDQVAYIVVPSLKGGPIETLVSIRCQKTPKKIVVVVITPSQKECKAIKAAYSHHVRAIACNRTHVMNPHFKENDTFEIVIVLSRKRTGNPTPMIHQSLCLIQRLRPTYVGIVEAGDLLESHHTATLTALLKSHGTPVACSRGPMITDMPPATLPSSCILMQGKAIWEKGLADSGHHTAHGLASCAMEGACALKPWTRTDLRTVAIKKGRYSHNDLNHLALDPSKTNILIMGYSDDPSKGGAITVTTNLATGLANQSTHVYMLINYFDNANITFYRFRKESKKFTFKDRPDLLKHLAFASPANLTLFDIIHVNCWHFGDDYIPFHKKRDPLKIRRFFDSFPMAHLVYTDHSDYSKDRRIINQGLPQELKTLGVQDFQALMPQQKEAFIQAHRLDPSSKATLTDGGYYWTTEMNDTFWARWTLMNFACKRQLMKLADKTVYVSKSQRDTIPLLCPNIVYGKQKGMARPSRPDVIYNGVDINRFHGDAELDGLIQELRNASGKKICIPRQGKVVLYLGRMDPHKGILHFARAIPIIARTHPDTLFLFVGGYSTGFDKEIFQATGHAPNVIVAGRIPGQRNAAALYKRADLTVQPTLGESFNQVAMESLFMGTPVAISNIDGPREIYVDNGFAIGLEPGNALDIARKISHTLGNLEQARAQVKQNMKRLIKTFHATEMCLNYRTLYTTLMEGCHDQPNALRGLSSPGHDRPGAQPRSACHS